MPDAVTLQNKVRDALPAMSRCEIKVAEVFLKDPVEFSELTVKEVSRQAHVSPPTVMRFCRTLGFDGFADCKRSLVAHAV
jgi:RpiR family carbohydrate utilization transcriptional regulator